MVRNDFSFRVFLKSVHEMQMHGDCVRLCELLDSLGENQDILTSRRFQSWFVNNVSEMSLGILNVFLEHAVNLNVHDGPRDASGSFPLTACIHAKNFEPVVELLRLGADPNLCDALFSVHYMTNATSEERIRMSAILIEHGADINQSPKNIPGYTVILKAMDAGDQELVQYLKMKGADLAYAPKEPCILDLPTFGSRLEKALIALWDGIRKRYPDEAFCLFGLETDSDCLILNGLVESEQAIDRAFANGKRSRRSMVDSYIGSISLDSDSEYYEIANAYVNALSDELNSVLCDDEVIQQHGNQKKAVLKILEGVLARLDGQGVFGRTPSERNRLILLVSIMDADEREWKEMIRIIKRLNPKNVVDQFVSSLS